MHTAAGRAAGAESAGTSWSTGAARTSGTAHERLAGTHGSRINRTAGNGRCGPRRGHSGTRRSWCGSRGPGRQARHNIGARGTTGRATGCPTKFDFAGGRSGIPLLGGVAAAGGAGVPGPCGRMAGRSGEGAAGMGPEGRSGMLRGDAGGAPGSGGLGSPLAAGGIGWRGPDKICPGRGRGGAGRTGIAGGRGGAGGVCPVDNGGRSGCMRGTGAAGVAFCGSSSLCCSLAWSRGCSLG